MFLTVIVLPADVLDKLVVAARQCVAVQRREKMFDPRERLDYPPNDRERFMFVRHNLLCRDERDTDKVSHTLFGYDHLITRIIKTQGEGAVLEFKYAVGALVRTYYPHLSLEIDYWLHLQERKYAS